MSSNLSPPQFPVGGFQPVLELTAEVRDELIHDLETFPGRLSAVIRGLDTAALDTRYRNWTLRQIVHHLADSHMHSYIRFKWTLTEEQPTIKAYEEADWVELTDCRLGDVEPSLSLLDGLHKKWVQVLRHMADDEFQRTFQRPQTGESVSLWQALNYYPWHGRHHMGQISWLKENDGLVTNE